MNGETYHRSVQEGLAHLRQKQRLNAWSLAIGIVTGLLTIFASGVPLEFGLPTTVGQWLTIMWLFFAWSGTLALLFFGMSVNPARRAARIAGAGLWMGNVAVCAGVAGYPLAIIILYLPVAMGAALIRRQFDGRFALAFLIMPVIALAGGIVGQGIHFQWFDG